jgi:hypothetical protein
MSDELIGLPHLRPRLVEMAGPEREIPTYRTLYGQVLNGTIPAEQH